MKYVMWQEQSMEYVVRQVRESEMPLLYRLRSRVLRPGRSLDTTVFPGDCDPTTIHLGAFTPDGEVLGVATLMESKGTQLRGMAVDPEVQGTGVGAALIREAHRITAERGRSSLWCNARTNSVGFYQKMGWVVESDEFEVPGVGPHYVMRYRVTSDEV